MSKRHKLLQNPKTNCNSCFSTTWGFLMYEEGKRNMQMLAFIYIELIPLNSFLGFTNVSTISSAYTYQSFFLSVRTSFLFRYMLSVACLKVLQFLNPLKVRLSLEKSIILDRNGIAITEKANSNDASA